MVALAQEKTQSNKEKAPLITLVMPPSLLDLLKCRLEFPASLMKKKKKRKKNKKPQSESQTDLYGSTGPAKNENPTAKNENPMPIEATNHELPAPEEDVEMVSSHVSSPVLTNNPGTPARSSSQFTEPGGNVKKINIVDDMKNVSPAA